MANHNSDNITTQNWIVLIFLSLVWGSSFILMKKALVSFSGVQVGSLRMSIAFLIFLPYCFFIFKKIPRKRFLPIFLIGLVGSFIPAFLFAIAQTKIDSAPTGILNSLVPLFTYVWGISVFGQKNNRKQFIGILIGLLGAVVLVLEPNSTFGINAYALLVLLATILYGLSSNIAKKYLQDVPPMYITAMGFGLIGIPALGILFSTNFFEVMQTNPNAWVSLGYVSILSIVGTALALLLFWRLIQETNPIFGSLTTYIMPIVAICWGLLDGEILVLRQYLGFFLIFFSVLLVKSNNKS